VLKVWGRKTSVNVQKVMWTVAELGLAHERADVGGAFGGLDTPQFAKLNPNRQIPVIEDDGLTLWESAAIIRHLARTRGADTLYPNSARELAHADQWMDWAATSLYADIISTAFIGLIFTPAANRNTAAVDASIARAGERLAILDAHLAGRSYILGDRLTVADIPAGGLMYRYFTLPIARPSLPNVEAWNARLAARPAYRDHVMIDYSALRVPGA
jgi:glutathione S-transferase